MHHLLLWAKSDPFHLLLHHLLDVAAVCEKLLPRFGGVSPVPNEWVVMLAALHDIGKADPWFQNKDPGLAAQLREQGLRLPEWMASADEDKRKFRHEARSAEWLLDWLQAQQGWNKNAARVASHAVRGHHGDFSPRHYYTESSGQCALWDPLRAALCGLVWDVVQPPRCGLQRFDHASAAGAKLSGLIVLADWIASNDELFPYTKLDRTATPLVYYTEARREADAVLGRLELDAVPVDSAAGTPAFQEVWPKLDGPPRPLQAKLEELCRAGMPPGLAIIEAPMGEGKTEAAVYLAECWNMKAGRQGNYLALPTQATANQMHDRYKRFLKHRRPGLAGPRLVHGMAWLIDKAVPVARPQMSYGDDDDPKAELLAREWFRPARRALLAPEGVGTVDQALLAALHVKFGFLRLLGLGTKTLLIDEVHAYDEFMTTIMERLMAWCRALRISVVLLSATLSQEQKMNLCRAYCGPDRRAEMQTLFDPGSPHEAPYPLLTFVPLDGPPRAVPADADPARTRRVVVQPRPGLLDDAAGTARLAASLVQEGGCACVLANTVRAAQEIFEALRQLQMDGALPKTELSLFHARFRAQQRNRIERRVTRLFGKEAGAKRPRCAILVATQVVEQSLDVDFDVMVSQLAPIDLLLQRSGRLWRHDDRSWRGGATRPVFHVLLPPDGCLKFGATEKVYARETLLRTLAVLHEREAFHLPADFRPLIESCYRRGPLPNDLIHAEELATAAQVRNEKREQDKSQAQRHLLFEPQTDVFEVVRPSAEEEGEGGAQSYFVAQTRLGDETRATLVLHDPALVALARTDLSEAKKPRREQRAPPRPQQKRLFLQKANLPAWWLAKVQPCDGYEPFFKGQAWLRGHLVLPLRDGEWRGRDEKGCEFLIRDDPVLGLQRLAVSLEGETREEVQEEADAGQTA